jgi:TetR/AcrR family transcriptional regulator, regulator of autoinduction and epiphytic fitness
MVAAPVVIEIWNWCLPRPVRCSATLVPNIESIADRAGLSIRSLYRYFDDGESLITAAIEQSLAEGRERARISNFGQGPFADRLEAFVSNRVKLFESSAAGYRATVHHAPNVAQLSDALHRTRRFLSDQVLGQFAPELGGLPKAERLTAGASCDAISQFDSLQHLRRFHGYSVRRTADVLRRTIALTLGQWPLQ